MVVICPKCKIKLKVPDERITPQGTRFKCPKCQALLLVKKPAPRPAPAPAARPPEKPAPLHARKILAAHSDPSKLGRMKDLLENEGFQVFTAPDGVEAMVQAMRERPFLIVVDAALPKILGFEVIKKLKERPETADIKSLLVGSIHRNDRYRREPASLHNADEYVDEYRLEDELAEKVRFLQSGEVRREEAAPPPAAERPAFTTEPPRPAAERPLPPPRAQEPPAPGRPAPAEMQRPQAAPAPPAPPERPKPAQTGTDDPMLVKARRLARTIVADINLYSPEKVETAIRQGNFQNAFSAELKEGKKLYDMRIPAEIRERADYFQEAIDTFVESKKKALGL